MLISKGTDMELDIKQLLSERTDYPIFDREDALLKKVLDDANEIVYYIGIEKYYRLMNAARYYNIAAIFDIANPFSNTDVNFVLLKLVKTTPKTVKISVYNKKLQTSKNDRATRSHPEWSIKENIPTDYKSYINEIEMWEKDEIQPKDTNEYEFNIIDVKDFETSNVNPKYYTKLIQNIKNNLSQENTVPLDAIAKILKPKIIEKEKGKVLLSKDFNNPINYHNIAIKEKTNVELKKGDIIIRSVGDFKSFLIMDTPQEKIYANQMDYVVRLFDDKYAPEYIQMYLNSDLYKNLLNNQSTGVAIKHLNIKAISEMKIIVPQKKKEFYQELYYCQVFPLEHRESYSNILLNQNKLEDFETGFQLEEIRKLSNNYTDEIKKVLTGDIEEVTACYKAGAYKATLILCGSVLEAFLLDWLNELQPEERWLEKDMHEDGKGYFGLNDYITKIEKIKRPNWMEEARKAQEIRVQRNLVHAKLCLKPDVTINKELCEKVIKYLIEVIHTRIDI